MFVLAFIIGIVSLILIEISGGMKTGKNFSIGAIIIPVSGTISMLCMFALIKVHNEAFNMLCGTNLSGISKAMIIYANDYDDEFPRAGGPDAKWGASVKWDASNPYEAYGLNQNRSATISSSLFLLVKYADISPKLFLCRSEFSKELGDKGVSDFEPPRDMDITKLWDFGPEPWKHVSYAYHNPYGGFPLTSASYPGMAIVADRNPWIHSECWGASDFSKFNPDGKKKAIKKGNNISHYFEGQHVAYADMHVDFEEVSFCGVNQDNIYTTWNGSDIRKGTQPVFGSQPASNTDSLLVNDPPIQKP